MREGCTCWSSMASFTAEASLMCRVLAGMAVPYGSTERAGGSSSSLHFFVVFLEFRLERTLGHHRPRPVNTREAAYAAMRAFEYTTGGERGSARWRKGFRGGRMGTHSALRPSSSRATPSSGHHRRVSAMILSVNHSQEWRTLTKTKDMMLNILDVGIRHVAMTGYHG